MDNQFIKYLKYKKHHAITRLLSNCTYNIESSMTFGMNGSYLSVLQFFTDIVTLEKLQQITQEDKINIIDAFHVIYPPARSGNEITSIDYLLDTSREIVLDSIEIEEKYNDTDFEFISEQIEKIDQKMGNNDFDGALTNSKALLESLLKTIISENKIEMNKNEDLMSLYKKVSKLLNKDPSNYEEKYFKKILSSFFQIIQGICEIRNKYSDSHGGGEGKNYKLEERHARLTIDSTKTICNFLYTAYFNSNHRVGLPKL